MDESLDCLNPHLQRQPRALFGEYKNRSMRGQTPSEKRLISEFVVDISSSRGQIQSNLDETAYVDYNFKKGSGKIRL